MGKQKNIRFFVSVIFALLFGGSFVVDNVRADEDTTVINNNTSNELKRSETSTYSREVIKSGVWGTSNWDYVREGDDYILHFHAGVLGDGGIYKIKYKDNDDQPSANIIRFDSDTTARINASGLFSNLSLTAIEGLDNLDTSQVTDMSYMFERLKINDLDLSSLDTQNVTNMAGMFQYSDIASLNLKNMNTSKVKNMHAMFFLSENIVNLDLSDFNTSQVTDMSDMFSGCFSLKSVDLSKFNTSQVNNMSGMFSACWSWTEFNLKNFNTSNTVNMVYMFSGCRALKKLDLSNFNTSKATNIFGMFYDCGSLVELNLSSFDTTNCVNSGGMFSCDWKLKRLTLGPKTIFYPSRGDAGLIYGAQPGTIIPETGQQVVSSKWVAVKGFGEGNEYTPNELTSLFGRDQVTTYEWDLLPRVDKTTETKAVTRTIYLHQPNNSVRVDKQTASIKRSVKINLDGTKIYGEWSKAKWGKYNVPKIKRYEASTEFVQAQDIDINTQDTTIDVFYEPFEYTVNIQYVNGDQVVKTKKYTGCYGDVITPNCRAPKGYELADNPPKKIKIDNTGEKIIKIHVEPKIVESSESKTVVRTINIQCPGNSPLRSVDQVAVISRNIYLNMANGTKTYGEWSQGKWDEVTIPTVEGYESIIKIVESKTVNENTESVVIDIVYSRK